MAPDIFHTLLTFLYGKLLRKQVKNSFLCTLKIPHFKIKNPRVKFTIFRISPWSALYSIVQACSSTCVIPNFLSNFPELYFLRLEAENFQTYSTSLFIFSFKVHIRIWTIGRTWWWSRWRRRWIWWAVNVSDWNK